MSKSLYLFVYHSYAHGDEQDKAFSKFVIKNFIKGIAISNTVLFLGYAAMFKNARNSNLALASIFATLIGMTSATHGLYPLFVSYQFSKKVPNSVLADEADFGRQT